jgi:ATPase subunit of ABC transporter with duplicated ATPase domains
MDTVVELTSLGATRYRGNWRHYHERKAAELAAARHDLANAEKRIADVAQGADRFAQHSIAEAE